MHIVCPGLSAVTSFNNLLLDIIISMVAGGHWDSK